MSSRLFQEVREKRGLVYSIYSFPTSFLDAGVFAVYAGTGPGEVEEVIPIVCDEISRLTDTVSEVEVARARVQLKASMLMSLESTSARCEQLARQLLVFGRPLSVSDIVAEVDAVDINAVNRVARTMMDHPVTLTGLGPITRMHAYEDVAARLRP